MKQTIQLAGTLCERAGRRVLKEQVILLSMMKLLILTALLSSVAVIHSAQARSTVEQHQLDGLDGDEISLAVALLREGGHTGDQTLFHYVGLLEPPKSEVQSESHPGEIVRRVVAVVRTNATTYEGIVNLTGRRVESWRELAAEQPNILNTEWALANRLVRADPRWRAALIKRGFSDFDEVYCASLTVGNFGSGETRRLVRMPCYDISQGGPNLYARPIEGFEATVDLDQPIVVSVQDRRRLTGALDRPDANGRLANTEVRFEPDDTAAPRSDQPKVEGSMIEWGNWSFHLRTDFRQGPVLSQIHFGQGKSRRSILYQASLSELVVPYMSEDQFWYYRAYMDVGEYGFGAASRLQPGLDCPSGAEMISSTFASDIGRPYVIANNACLFVRSPAQPLWRHSEIFDETRAIEPGQELVLRSTPAVGNYDYIIDWVFSPTGEIRIEVGATGIVAVRADEASSSAPADGTRVAPGLVAVNHDHFFSFRLDFDIEGVANRVQVDRIALVDDSDVSPRRIWKTDPQPITVEGPLSGGAEVLGWRVLNEESRNLLGQAPAYQVQNGHSGTSLLLGDAWTVARSRYSTAPIWVTRLGEGEQFAAGRFPNQSEVNRGLPEYVNGENVVDTDIVLWPTLGMHHVPRPEEWPIMPTMSKRIVIRPIGFFSNNPAVPLSDGGQSSPADQQKARDQ